MPEPMTESRKRLLLKAAKRIREAITERAERLDHVLLQYDRAVESQDENEIQATAIMLIMLVTIGDPVQSAVRQYMETDAMLREAKGE